jgi:tetratricopeptide (TPR) repeat protein
MCKQITETLSGRIKNIGRTIIMKTNKQNIDLIEKYLDDKLDPQELDLFNRKLREDPEFHRLYFDMDRLVEGIRLSARTTTLEEKLANLEGALPFQKSDGKKNDTPVISLRERMMQYKGAIAAAITLLFVAAFALTTLDFGTDPGKLYAKYQEPFDNYSGQKRSVSVEEVELSEMAFQFYDQGDYQQALDIFIQLENQAEADVDPSVSRWLYMGNAYMELGNMDSAISMFRNVIDRNSGLVVQAKWYMALCYLKQENLEIARTMFTELAEQGKYKSAESARILDKID